MSEPQATIAITTHNRKDELRKAIASALTQDVPVEVLVIDDASSDGTAEMVRQEFPQVRLDRTEQNLGLIEQRNRAAKLARAPILVSIDDDAVFLSPSTVRQTLVSFADPRVAVVAIPYVDVLKSPDVHQKAPDKRLWIVSEYRGTAHALRVDLFLKLGGYRGHLFRQGEEADYSIRVIDAGHLIALGNADPIHHFESPRRNTKTIMYFTGRNNVLFAWHNTPAAMLPVHILATIANCLRAGWNDAAVAAVISGLAAGLAGIARYWSSRRAVSSRAYFKFRILRRGGPECLNEASISP